MILIFVVVGDNV